MNASGIAGATGDAATATPVAPVAPVRWDARRWSLLFVLSGNMLLDAVEVSVVLVALPTIGAHFDRSALGVQWLMSGFALGFATLLVVGPRLSARLGRRRTYLGAMAVFVVASLAGGLVNSLVVLVALRVVKGGCAALTAPVGLAIVNEAFPEGPERRRAVSVYALFGAVGFTAGLLLSGSLIESSWRWAFVFPAPIALVLLLFGLQVLPRSLSATPPQRRPRSALLQDRSLRHAAIGAASLNGTYQSLVLLVTFQASDELGWTPWQTALALLPACAPLMLTVPFAGRLVARYGTGRLIALGALFPLLGYLLYLARPDPSPYVLGLLPPLLLVEAGFCCAFAALNMQATSSVDAADRGAAVALYQTCVQLGAGLLLPLVVLLRQVDGIRPSLALVSSVGALGLVAALISQMSVPEVPDLPNEEDAVG